MALLSSLIDRTVYRYAYFLHTRVSRAHRYCVCFFNPFLGEETLNKCWMRFDSFRFRPVERCADYIGRVGAQTCTVVVELVVSATKIVRTRYSRVRYIACDSSGLARIFKWGGGPNHFFG
jgi:hypothetical protein